MLTKIFLISVLVFVSTKVLIEIFKSTISKEDLTLAFATNEIPARFIIVGLMNFAAEIVALVSGFILGLAYIITG